MKNDNKKLAKVGISLFTYNKGELIYEAINSLKQQTFQDFDLYILDDASTDQITPSIVENLKYEKIKLKKISKTNKGLAERREESYAYIKNTYILDFDGDDILDKDYLKKTVDFLDKHPEYSVVCTDFNAFTKDPSEVLFVKKYDAEKMCLPYLLSNCNILGSSLMRKKDLDKIKWKHGNLSTCPDWDRYISMAESGMKFALIDEPLFYYRQDEKSMSHSIDSATYYKTLTEIISRHKSSYMKYIDAFLDDFIKQYSDLLEGKTWLANQYDSLTAENEELRNKVAKLNNKLYWYKKPVRKLLSLKRRLTKNKEEDQKKCS